ncbi:histidine kinase [Caulobacter sp. D4A]|uniref:sensor histidine kinase n=1 Tax=unclassified Caulobacter TaxID=2648921 RepID=UPI000D733BE7|nr:MULTISPECIES: histidine kinase dimerization/phosphoacceptor domain -containing protein [unclassified Caulobacter]PXA74366.1 histidine kinase [Caulobacter sp. D4A]PXA93548.1 histidine kinase [Caulobacter sp. D5]
MSRVGSSSIALRYASAVAAAAAAFFVRLALNSWFPPGFPYLTFFPAIVLTAYFAGRGPAILCATLSGLAAWYFFIPPYNSFRFDFATMVAIAFYVFVTAVDIFFIDGMRQTMRKLAVERESLADLARSRDLLYREMHHRVSNNIQVVGALLRLQSSGVKDEDARHALTEAGGRIETIAKIQRQLHDQTGEPTPFRSFAEALLDDAGQAAGARHAVRVEGGEAPLHPEQATPVTLVMLECFNNALEHAFASGSDGRIVVALEQDGADHVLTIRDNGGGPPDGFEPARSQSLGLRIVHAMARQLGGAFTMARIDGWTVCRLTYTPTPA